MIQATGDFEGAKKSSPNMQYNSLNGKTQE